MIFTIDEANEILHLDGGDNDLQVMALIEALPPYLYHATGYRAGGGIFPHRQDRRPVSPVAMVLWGECGHRQGTAGH